MAFIAQPLANYRLSYGPNATAQAAIDGRSMHDLRLWLNLLANNELPYHLTPEEEYIFRSGIYEIEMHFAAMAARCQQEDIKDAYIAFAEEVFPGQPSPDELKRMRQVHLNLHQGLCAFQDYQFKEARSHFLQAIKTGLTHCKSPWIWNKLLLTFVGKTKWGVLYK